MSDRERLLEKILEDVLTKVWHIKAGQTIALCGQDWPEYQSARMLLDHKHRFDSLNVGEIFMFAETFYMKINSYLEHNTVHMSQEDLGYLCTLTGETTVRKLTKRDYFERIV